MTRIPSSLAALWLSVSLALQGAGATTLDMVVLEARGAKLSQGQIIDGRAILVLESGQQVTLMGQDGKVVKIRGPAAQTPIPPESAPTADVAVALRSLIAQEEQRERSGLIRGGEARVPPDPWLIDVGGSGLRCLPPGAAAILWQPDSKAHLPLRITPADHSWRLDAEWDDDSDRFSLPSDLPPAPRGSFNVKLGAREVTVVLKDIPEGLNNDAMRASYMMEVGCGAQAKALFAQAGLAVK